MTRRSTLASKNPKWSDQIPDLLSKAVIAYNLPETIDWAPLEELSSLTQFEGVDVDGEASILEGGVFVAPATVYVRLVYDPNSAESLEFDDSYPARAFFTIDDETVTITKIDVDTKSFYE